MSLRACLRLADKNGCSIRKPRRTGEILVEYAGKRIRVNCRRKDAPTALVCFVKKVIRNKES